MTGLCKWYPLMNHYLSLLFLIWLLYFATIYHRSIKRRSEVPSDWLVRYCVYWEPDKRSPQEMSEEICEVTHSYFGLEQCNLKAWHRLISHDHAGLCGCGVLRAGDHYFFLAFQKMFQPWVLAYTVAWLSCDTWRFGGLMVCRLCLFLLDFVGVPDKYMYMYLWNMVIELLSHQFCYNFKVI